LSESHSISRTLIDSLNTPIETLTNLIYLAKHESSSRDEVVKYLDMAEAELGRLIDVWGNLVQAAECSKQSN
jgi:hypothetical protein